MGEGENPDMVPGTNVSGETRQNRVIRKSRVGWGRGGTGKAGVLQRGLLKGLGLRWGQDLGTGTQGIRSLENGLANESLDAGGWGLGRRSKSKWRARP